MKILTDLIHDDLFPPERLDRMRSKTSRVETTHFIRTYHSRIYAGRSVPYHWHKFASDVLSNAAEAVFGDHEKYQGPLADIMGLQGRDSKQLRNDHICFSVQQYLDRGDTQGRAFVRVSERLVEREILLQPNTIRRTVWPRRNVEWTEIMAKELPDADFLAFLFSHGRSV